ncbi:restriction endonuclease subunit S [Microbispora rosea]|uniref:restriction endonuclease subunit S n=1 Tax=Microbispora rosea TaxID=58117 RepID=UPI0037CB4CE7
MTEKRFRLEDLCEQIVDCKNRTPPVTNSADEAVGYAIGTPDILNGRIILDDDKRVNQETYDTWTQRAVPQAGDVVLTREAPVGRVGLVESDMKICLGQRTMLLRADQNRINSRYLTYLLMSPQVQNELTSRASGSTVSHLRVAQVRALPLPEVPPLYEQQAIAEVLGALDDKIAVNERMATIGLELGDALLERAVQEESLETTIGDIAELVYGKSLPEPTRRPGHTPVFGCTGRVGWHDTPLTPSRGPVVGRKGANAGHVSWMSTPGWVIDTAFYARPLTTDIPAEALYFVLNSAGLKSLIGDSAVPGVNRDLALRRRIRIPVPRLMSGFRDQACGLLDTFVHVEAENRTLAELHSTLLPQLVTRKIRVKDAVRVVEAVA